MVSMPGSFPGQADRVIGPPSARLGQFHDVGRFMIIPPTLSNVIPKYGRADSAQLEPGSIIYIQDEDLRLDRRVMLVLKRASEGYSAFTFCTHWPPTSMKAHWNVCRYDRTKESDEGNDSKSLKMILWPFGPEPECPPQDNITINIQDVWTVENDVQVATLGIVERRSLRKFAEDVKVVFCESVDIAIPPIIEIPIPLPDRNQDRRRTSAGDAHPRGRGPGKGGFVRVRTRD